MRFYLLVCFFILSGCNLFGQIQILDAETNESIPFVKVSPNVGNAFISDIDGYFSIENGTTLFNLKSYGYSDTTIVFTNQTKVYLRSLATAIDEVVVLPGENPAERIMELAIQNRKSNHPKSDVSFQCTNYSKFTVTANKETLLNISDTTTDTTLISIRDFFSEQHLFLLESTSEKAFRPPFREKEVITAYKVSGFSDPLFSTFANEMQSFHFYENQFQILGNNYLSPLAFGSIRRYLFILEDTTINSKGDSTFTIRFRPRKDKNFDGMEGTLFISSNKWAVEKVIAVPKKEIDTTIANITIVQEYEFVDNKKWFPKKLSTEFSFPSISLNSKIPGSGLEGRSSTYIENIRLGLDLSDENFNTVELTTNADANEKDSTHWEEKRKYELTEKERLTYKNIDSLSEANGLDKKLGIFSSLIEGKIPLGKFQLDIPKTLNYNLYEGLRLGLALETSPKLWKRAQLGGYFGYGFKDKTPKYGGYASYYLHPNSLFKIDASITRDVIFRGGNNYTKSPTYQLSTDQLNGIYTNQMDLQEKVELGLSAYVQPRLFVRLSANQQRLFFTEDYRFEPTNSTISYTKVKLFETSIDLQWSPGDKLKQLGLRRISLGSKYPRFALKLTHGISGVACSELDYSRILSQISYAVPIRAVGKLQVLLQYQSTLGNVPLTLMHSFGGSAGNWNLSTPNQFETLLSNRYYQQSMAANFVRFTFKSINLNKKWTNPAFGFHHGLGWGEGLNIVEHALDFETLKSTYAEAGVFVNSLLIMNTSGFGLGYFYNYSGAVETDWRKNGFVKITLSTRF